MLVVVLVDVLFSLSLAISRLPTSSNRFCAIKFNMCDGQSFLTFSVYVHYIHNHPTSFTDYLNALGDIHGRLIHAQSQEYF
jgi:hypothetical protein